MNKTMQVVCFLPSLIEAPLLTYFLDFPIIGKFPPDSISKGGGEEGQHRQGTAREGPAPRTWQDLSHLILTTTLGGQGISPI